MAYTRTQAKGGKGFIFAVNTGTASSPTWTTVGEAYKGDMASKWDTDDATNFQSSGSEKIYTMPDGGAYKFSVNRVSTDTGQAAIQTAYVAGNLLQVQLTAPLATGQMTTGDTWAGYVLIAEYNPSFEPTKKISNTGTMENTNGWTYTEGS